MSARSQVTLCAQDGGVEEAVTEDHVGSPERLLKNELAICPACEDSFEHLIGTELTLWM
jgi:hypothetical protein